MSKSSKIYETISYTTLLRCADVIVTELEACRCWCEDNEPNTNILNRMYRMVFVLESLQNVLWGDFKYEKELKEMSEYVYYRGGEVLEKLNII